MVPSPARWGVVRAFRPTLDTCGLSTGQCPPWSSIRLWPSSLLCWRCVRPTMAQVLVGPQPRLPPQGEVYQADCMGHCRRAPLQVQARGQQVGCCGMSCRWCVTDRGERSSFMCMPTWARGFIVPSLVTAHCPALTMGRQYLQYNTFSWAARG